YRVNQLRELFGDSLDDPDTRFELELVLRAAPATCSESISGPGPGSGTRESATDSSQRPPPL
nr:helix-turn-helix domain-containing protein [Micromonospora sp. DSM 115978]